MTITVPGETTAEIRELRKALDGQGFFITAEERDATIDRIKEKVADILLTIAVNSDRQRQHNFLLEE